MENYYGNCGLDRESKSILIDYFAVPKNRVDTIYEKYLANYPSEAITEVLKHLMLNSDASPKLNVILELLRHKMNANQEDAFKIFDMLFKLNEHGKTFKERKVLVLTYFNSSFKGKFKYELVPFSIAENICKNYKTLINSIQEEFRVFVKFENQQLEETIDVEKSKKLMQDLNAWINYLKTHHKGRRSINDIIDKKIFSSDFFNANYETIEKYC